MVKVEIDEGSGFCFGVVTAIHKAEEELAKGVTLYCLGDIVHNSREVERLKEMGLITINHEEFKQLHNAKVLLRAHGEPPETYIIAKENNIEIIDEARRLDFSKSIRLYSQTTKSLDEFWEIVEYIKEHISPDVTFEYYDTICRQVANRMPNLRKFAASHDLIFFVSGKKSSNGKMLFEECKKVNPNSHLIDSADEIDDSLLPGVNSIGVCGATSTPKWLMEEISEAIKAQIKRQ